METFKNNLSAKIVVPTLVGFATIITLLILYVSQVQEKHTLDSNVHHAEEIINQFKLLREYYTKNVVSVVKTQSKLKISFDHHQKSDTIPLPATMIHDLSKLLSQNKSGVQLKLYSAFPFPNRRDRQIDNFGQEAIKFFTSEPDGKFIRTEVVDGEEIVRVAIADKMVAPACVACHNTRPDTPKNDWKLNDVRGVLEVITPISTQIQQSRQLILQESLILIIGGMIIIGLLFLIVVRTT